MNTQTIHNNGDGTWGNYTYSFTYDNMNRLTNANSANQTFNAVYAYDGDGHMTSSSMNNVTASTPRMLNSHRISSYGGSTIEYDNKGNVTYEGLTGWRTNEFNKSNLPLNMTNGTMSYTFRYNEKGERTNKNFSNGTEEKNEYYLNDFLGRTLAVYEDGRMKEGIINGNDVIGEIEVGAENDNRYYYLKDHLGSIRVVLESPSSAIVSATDFGPYGETLRQMNDSIEVRYDYTGKEKDKESGDRYFGARYLGVLPFWKSVDPLAEKYPSLSPYSYVGGNPLKYLDPNGNEIKNSGNYVFANMQLIERLILFDKYVSELSGKPSSTYVFEITGGDRYIKDGKVYSKTNNSLVEDSRITSRHIDENGARAVDLSYANGISLDVIKQAATSAGFNEQVYNYNDGHFHLGLPAEFSENGEAFTPHNFVSKDKVQSYIKSQKANTRNINLPNPTRWFERFYSRVKELLDSIWSSNYDPSVN